MFPRAIPQNTRIVLAAASAAGSSNSDSGLNPYEVISACILHRPSKIDVEICLILLNLFVILISYVSQVLGVNPIEGFDMVKAAYTKKHKEAVSNGDEETAARVGFNSLSL